MLVRLGILQIGVCQGIGLIAVKKVSIVRALTWSQWLRRGWKMGLS